MGLTPWYTNRREAKLAIDSAESARDNFLVDQAIAAATADIESQNLTDRRWYPWTGTRYYDWPTIIESDNYILELPTSKEVLTVSSLTAGGSAISLSDFFLEPDERDNRAGATQIHIDRDSSAALISGTAGAQRAIAIVGQFGSWSDERITTTLNEALDTSETQIDLNSGSSISVGDLIRVDSERMIVTEEAMTASGQTLQANIAASMAGQAVTVSVGAEFSVGEVILIDTERMLITAVSGNTLIVKRAVDGTTLAAHTSTTAISAVRTFTVERGAVGTTAATHSDDAVVYRHYPPDLIRLLTRAQVVYTRLQEGGGWGNSARAGDTDRRISQAGIEHLRNMVMSAHGPLPRAAAI